MCEGIGGIAVTHNGESNEGCLLPSNGISIVAGSARSKRENPRAIVARGYYNFHFWYPTPEKQDLMDE